MTAVRPLRDICADVQRANCGHCWAEPSQPCVFTGTTTSPVRGYHAARFGRAERHGLITAADLESATAGLPLAAVVWDNGDPPRLPDAPSDPFETEQQVRELPAVQAVYEAFRADPGPGRMTLHCHRILTDALSAAGVELGAYDHRIVQWASQWGPETAAIIASWITRAHRTPQTEPAPEE